MKKILLPLVALTLVSCATSTNSGTTSTATTGGRGPGGTTSADTTSGVDFSASKWSFDSTNNVYYQLKVTDCVSPANAAYEAMSIYVPGAYFNGTANSDGTYTCTVNASGSVGSYTASSAPIVMPVNTPGYAGQAAPSAYSYSSLSSYLSKGFIYVIGGMRGFDISAGEAPWGVTDLKAAVRAYRYHASDLPGDKTKIFTFGHSGGGAQSSLMGASGDSPLYTPYLNAIGAYMSDANGTAISDAIAGAMCWCPITELDYADAAYEWNMGQFYSASTRASTTWTSALSLDLADAYAGFINALGLKDGTTALSLAASSNGHYLSGSYYDYIVGVANTSLNNYLASTYSSTSTRASYVSGLGSWVSYDATGDKATITDFAGFIQARKNASKPVGAFDGVARGSHENALFRLEDSTSSVAHFDALESKLLADNNSKYTAFSDYADYRSDFTSDLASNDAQGISMETRVSMYNPLYYLSSYYAGAGTSSIAPHWRIRTGLKQPDTAMNTEVNLALALTANSHVSDVDFATIWDQAHVTAEAGGSNNSTANFIAWVESVLA
jgi:hypothetical protein